MASDALHLLISMLQREEGKHAQNEACVKLWRHLNLMAILVSRLLDAQGSQDEHHSSPETSSCKMPPWTNTTTDLPAT